MRRLLSDPRVQRWLPVIVLPPVLLLDGLLGHPETGVTALSVLLAYVAVLPLALRERLGFVAMAPLLTGGVVLVLWNFEPGTTVVAVPAWALFDLVRERGRREAIIAAIAIVPCVAVSVIPFCEHAGEFVSITLRNIALCELAIAAGYLVWHNRAALERELAAREVESDRQLGEERLRIAREVHDVVAHAMVAINVQAGVAAHLIDEDTEQAREALLQIKRTSGDALTDLRATLGVLRDPGQAAPIGPAAGLGDLERAAGQLRAAGVEVVVDVDTIRPVPPSVHAASYRIVQEALTNVLRHAGARTVTVLARADERAVRIVIADDGTGPADRSGAAAGAGAGVRGMRERAAALGGTLTAGPGEDGGWRVEARLPLDRVRARS